MKRANQLINISSSEQLHRHTAFHEAGHVASIYIRNAEQELPDVFFEIIFSENQEESDYFKARVEGGCLIENLCIAGIESKRLKTNAEKSSLQKAYQADIVNLLAGALAEAKYVSLRDNETFNHHLVNLAALKNYGGKSDVEQAMKYLEYFIDDEKQRVDILKSLFIQSFKFINNPKNWYRIHKLANYILNNNQSRISHTDASIVLNSTNSY